MNRLQYVQYECIKTELKEEYDKRINFLHKRIEKKQMQQGPYQDAHLVLMQNSIAEINDMVERGKKGKGREGGSPGKQNVHLPGMKPKVNQTFNRNEKRKIGTSQSKEKLGQPF